MGEHGDENNKMKEDTTAEIRQIGMKYGVQRNHESDWELIIIIKSNKADNKNQYDDNTRGRRAPMTNLRRSCSL